MPRNLLDLPQDVLNSCFEMLLPPLDSCVLLHKRAIPIPKDLHRLQLVCKRLYSLALPWAWRRIAFNVRPDCGESRIYYPERFPNVRLFKLDVTRSDEELFAVLPRLKRCIAFMDKLQVLILIGKEIPGRRILDQVYVALTSRPRLHTLLVSSYAPRKLPSLTGLKRLIIHDIQLSLKVPALESLVIPRENSRRPGLSPLPWGTLRDIGLYDFHAQQHVVQDFSAWRKAFPDIVSPLQDIYMNFAMSGAEFHPEDVQQMLEMLKGQDIRCLSLLGLPRVEWNLISNVAEAFPCLQELTITHHLASEGIAGPWSIVDALGRLPLLKYLGWQLTEACFQPTNEDPWTRILVDIICQRCPVIEVVTIMSTGRAFDVRYEVKRDGTGKYRDCVARTRDHGIYSTIRLSSSWRSAQYDSI